MNKIAPLVALTVLLAGVPARAATTEISQSPIAVTASAQAKPNIMLLMDNSGSMGWTHMPDEVEIGGYQGGGVYTYTAGHYTVGYKSAQCNSLYYNPNVVYEVPKDPGLVAFAASTYQFTSARTAGYGAYFLTPDLSTTDLSTAFQAYTGTTIRTGAGSDAPRAAYYYVYTGPQTLTATGAACRTADPADVNNPSYDPALAGTTTAHNATVTAGGVGGGTWTRKIVSASEQTNFAIWFVYYRTRLALVKSASSLAFAPLSAANSNYRVGFITVDPKDTPSSNAINATKFYVPINDFNVAQTGTWFTKLFSQEPRTASPTREGLARVGRHYGGMQNGINTNMTGDPLQYSCQQNFTILTTDGYWNAQTEVPGAGPVQLDGTTPVGQLDGTLTADTGLSPSPIWEGQVRDTHVTTDKNVAFSYGACGSFQNMTTTQVAMRTEQHTRTTSQATQRSEQRLANTEQRSETTRQRLAATYQVTSSTLRRERSTSQVQESTTQRRQYTTQIVQFSTQIQDRLIQLQRSTNQITRTTSQFTRATSQTTRQTQQQLRSTTRVEKRTTQITASTTQTTQSTLQRNRTDSQTMQSTSQTLRSTEQLYKRTTQHRKCDASTEQCTPVAAGSCTAGGFIYCETTNTGPTLVPACTNDPVANPGNNYTTTSCSSATTGPTAVQTCTAESANAGNNYTRTTCTPNNTAPTPVGTCTGQTASAGNNWTTTSCTPSVTGPTPVGTCTNATPNAGNNWTTTTCTNTTSGPTGVASCMNTPAAAGNSWTETTCGTNNSGPTGVASCTNTSAAAGNSWTQTSCNTAVVGYAPASSCTPEAAGAGNSWVRTECQTYSTGPDPVASCTGSSGSIGNNWTTTACSNNNSAVVGVSSCTPVAASAGNSWTATVCANPTTPPTGTATLCTSESANAGNSWTTITCATNNTGPTPVASCANDPKSAGNGYTLTTCGANNSGPTGVASCTPDATRTAGNSFTAVTCNDVQTRAWANASACTADPGNAGNNWVRRECRTVNGTPVGVSACTASGPNSSGAGVGCDTINTGPTPVASCTPTSGNAGNQWVGRTCDWNNTGPTYVPSCTPQTAAAGNSWTNRTCNPISSGPTPVASCTPQTASAANNWETITCNNVTTAAVGVQTCNNVPPSGANNNTETICGAVSTPPTPVSSCNNTAAAAGNQWTRTTCSNNNSGPTLVGTCIDQTASAGNNWVTRTCSSVRTGPTPVASCSYAAPVAGNNFVETTCSDNNSLAVPVASCTSQTRTGSNNWTETICGTVTNTQGVSTPCSNQAPSGGNSWTTTTCTTVNTGPTLVVPGTCAATVANSGNNWVTTYCDMTRTGPSVVSSCTPQTANAGNNYVEITCTAAAGRKIQYTVRTDITTQIFSGGNPVTAPSTTTGVSGAADLTGQCYAIGTEPALPADGSSPQAGVGPVAAAPCTGWPCTVKTQNGLGSTNSLADVAQYYYQTDLRPLMKDDVPSVGSNKEEDRVRWQHMTTFVVGLGVSGTLDYRKDYRSATTGHFADIRNMTRAWPIWPDPAINYADSRNWEHPKAIDDFWHTAVNGRGQFFSAGDPKSVVNGLSDALAGIDIRLAAGAPVGFSNYRPVSGDNYSFTSSYQTANWIGDITAAVVDVNTGAISGTAYWSAQKELDKQTSADCDNRRIFLSRPGASGGKVNFTWNTYACDGTGNRIGGPDTGLSTTEQLEFGTAKLSAELDQWIQMTSGQQAAAVGPALVNFLRGQRGNETFASGDVDRLFRTRTHVLGDIIGSQPVYVGAPTMTFQDPGYDTFKTNKASRTRMVYAGGNDGMLHAFYAGSSPTDPNGGKEAWAYIPQAVLPNLRALAGVNYKKNHRFFVDGTPTVADAYDNGSFTTTAGWKTILVGGLNAGGNSYYAIDVTDPVNPIGLWEFQRGATCHAGVPDVDTSDCHLGLSFGNPIVTKRADGKWVVIVTSGYNNVNSPTKTGDGKGYLYVLDAFSGRILDKINTGAGDDATPSGLAHVAGYVDYPIVDNTTRHVYGGDQLGNIWRFDINGTIAPAGRDAALLGVAKDTSGNRQPITTRPELAELNSRPMVFVGTGQLLGAPDVTSTGTQSVYGIKDPLTAGPGPVYPDLRAVLRPRTLTTTGATRTIACAGTAAECGRQDGWVVDLPTRRERMNVDMRLAKGTLVFASNIPNDDPCNSGGNSWVNYLDFSSGLAVGTASEGYYGALAAGVTVIETTKLHAHRRTVDPNTDKTDPPHVVPPPGGKRISWREIAN